jgi:hypothetical protein
MENPMAARFKISDSKLHSVAPLANETLKGKKENCHAADLKRQLASEHGKGKSAKSLVMPYADWNQHNPPMLCLLLIGTTEELKEFRNQLKGEGIDQIDCQNHDELVTWCVRVDANHPDHVMGTSTLTLLVIGGKSAIGDETPKPPWKSFGVTQKGRASMKLDNTFDEALDTAKKLNPVKA